MTAKPHTTLWLDAGDIVLQAEDTLFRLESSVLRAESQFFFDMLALELPRGSAEGTEQHPLAVLGVSAPAFANAIRMAYDLNAECHPIDDYVGVLHVAHRFQFDRVHFTARQRLAVDHASTPEGPMLRLHAALSGRCGVDGLARMAFEELALARSAQFPDISLLHPNVQRILTSLRASILKRRRNMAHNAARKLTCQGHWPQFGAVVDRDGGIAEGRRCFERLRNECMRCLRVASTVHLAGTSSRNTCDIVLRRGFARGHELRMVADAWQEVLAGEYSSHEPAAGVGSELDAINDRDGSMEAQGWNEKESGIEVVACPEDRGE
ncbi:hypothetical protein AURDEDRAFT_161747 [Auricularia subglabra TFB-10046 SS5]|nr:hypothetical protein AURDEDRAFT_161747 [Auricularia subglabra TFB-10046 SS5]